MAQECPECGYPINGERVCPECGYQLEQATATPEIETTQESEICNTESQCSNEIVAGNDPMQNRFSYILGQVGDYIYDSFLIAKEAFDKKRFDFQGRASRREYFSFLIVWGEVMTLAAFMALLTSILVVPVVVFILNFVAYLIAWAAVTVRRLHDAGHSGWWLFFPPYCVFYMFQKSAK